MTAYYCALYGFESVSSGSPYVPFVKFRRAEAVETPRQIEDDEHEDSDFLVA
ncbi:hypothetical protein TWF506_003653 [Arthrobotrys conoides]|uniref:Uncharacterized protein n=1 Tax=Arthrobotrys conoides TaxID=74498 RepID=A0AAN8N2L6_9PEZI